MNPYVKFCFLVFIFAFCVPTRALQRDHILYLMKNHMKISKGSCSQYSPEIFFHEVAYPSLSLLYLQSKTFFGTLMDQIESSSVKQSSSERENSTKEQWESITKTVGSSLDSAIDRVETSWNYFIISYETSPLPWERRYKSVILSNALYQIEYNYLMVESVIRAGTKEIVGTLKHQLTNVIRQLEEEVSKTSETGDEITEQKLFKQMKQALTRMKSSFSTKLLEKVVNRAMEKYHSSNDPQSGDTFLSAALNQMAIVFHAFREKNSVYHRFWLELSQIFSREFKISSKIDENDVILKFIHDLLNEDHLIQLIVKIISRDNKHSS